MFSFVKHDFSNLFITNQRLSAMSAIQVLVWCNNINPLITLQLELLSKPDSVLLQCCLLDRSKGFIYALVSPS